MKIISTPRLAVVAFIVASASPQHAIMGEYVASFDAATAIHARNGARNVGQNFAKKMKNPGQVAKKMKNPGRGGKKGVAATKASKMDAGISKKMKSAGKKDTS